MKKGLIILIIFIFSYNALFSRETNIIIIGGGNDYHSAVYARAQYDVIPELKEQIVAEVEIILSDSVKGLNPGFYIAVIGYCDDDYIAHLIMNLANTYWKGVYIKKVDIDFNTKKIGFYPDDAPFTAKDYIIFDKKTNLYYSSFKDENSIFNNKKIKNIKVRTNKVFWSEKSGLIETKYFVAWSEETHEVFYLNQLQFTNMFLGGNNWDKDCDIVSSDHKFDEFEYTETEENCLYNNGVMSYSSSGYEYYDETIKFPVSDFSFDDVFSYYINNSYFDILYDINPNELVEGKTNYKDECEIEFIDGKYIMIDCYHEWTSIEIDTEGFIVVNYGGGA